ncbi:hypothetical protein [Streptomyces parvulus]|uniref:hypothetical protein n=1 Tax=Streptomyces parvulus TaxID=146923 RepID=UPI0033C393C2
MVEAQAGARPLGRLTLSGEKETRVPEEVLARSVFGPLGGVVEIGAVNVTGTWRLADVSVGAFVAPRQSEVDRILHGVRSVCGFGDAAMAIADQLGYFDEHEVSTALLLLWSEGITGLRQPLERLAEPPLVRRMCRIGADLQLTRLLQALVTAALSAGTEARQGARGIAEILHVAAGLADPTDGRISPVDIHRLWHVAHLPDILRPASNVPDWGRDGYRAYDEELEAQVQRAF